jgi:hypothetical protein
MWKNKKEKKMSKCFNKGKHIQIIHDDRNITCDCTWSSLYPNNYKEGKKVCRHIKEVIETFKNN